MYAWSYVFVADPTDTRCNLTADRGWDERIKYVCSTERRMRGEMHRIEDNPRRKRNIRILCPHPCSSDPQNARIPCRSYVVHSRFDSVVNLYFINPLWSWYLTFDTKSQERDEFFFSNLRNIWYRGQMGDWYERENS